MIVNTDNRRFKTVFKIFFAWQEKREEKWLREMSMEGWHLDNTSFLNYVFRKGEPKDMIYRLDFKIIRNENIDDYITLFEDAGWEYISRVGWWYYFRTVAKKGRSQELYSDNASKIRMYNSLRWLLIITCVPIVYNLPNLYGRVIKAMGAVIVDDPLAHVLILNFAFPLAIFLTLVLCLMVYGIIRISIVIKRIKSDIRE
jgi:hypothetical protein